MRPTFCRPNGLVVEQNPCVRPVAGQFHIRQPGRRIVRIESARVRSQSLGASLHESPENSAPLIHFRSSDVPVIATVANGGLLRTVGPSRAPRSRANRGPG